MPALVSSCTHCDISAAVIEVVVEKASVKGSDEDNRQTAEMCSLHEACGDEACSTSTGELQKLTTAWEKAISLCLLQMVMLKSKVETLHNV